MTEEHEDKPLATVSPTERFTDDTLAKLRGQLSPKRIAYDRQNNPYLEGWDVIAAANYYFGFDGWITEIVSIEPGARFQALRGRNTPDEHTADLYVYTARIRITAGGVSREDVGTSPTATDTPEAHETAIKAAVTDGIKRTLRSFGSQFGNDLYDKGRTGGYEEQRIPERDVREPAPAQQPAPAAPTDAPPMKNSGDFLMACLKRLGMHRADVLKMHNAERAEDLAVVMAPLGSWEAMLEATKRMKAGVLV